MKRRFFKSRFLLIGLIASCVVWFGQALAADRGNGRPVVKVMTQNLYLGANLDIILNECDLTAPPPVLLQCLSRGVTLFLLTVESTDFTERAEALAREIQRQKPDVIGLQEVALFKFLSLTGEDPVVIDYKEILLDALQARNLDYEAAITSDNTMFMFPLPDGILQFTDRDAVLVRNNVRISDAVAMEFKNLLPLPSTYSASPSSDKSPS